MTLLELPPEIREKIYHEVLCSENSKRYYTTGREDPLCLEERPTPRYEYDLSLLRVSKLVHLEAQKVFQDNVFVKITTPWEQSVNHINIEGKVPIIARGQKAAEFEGHHLQIFIDSPNGHQNLYGNVSMITCLGDLPDFVQMWRYTDLNNQQALNPNLRLKLIIRDPHVPGMCFSND